ncbi:alpha-ribazole-5-phosphate synthase [Clostridium sp. 19966]|uniref:AIR synthase related protein n=1 Tax=Clostridium sp. 19966 TaxID=2768166 RepID=UPI0028DFEDA3|nr:AIR synthase related protein [Clostridium sp. 19966]MDT8717362.1 alpha-ribazole-5-phosphate synthase [Clostridium sp. 19966]
MESRKIRDLSLIELDTDRTMVIACDSCGSIGMKSGDELKVPPIYVGKMTVRVAIMEVMCSGADIISVIDAVCNEMEPTGSEIIKGIKEELKLAGIKDITLTGSTEENFKTCSTGLGITVVGIARNKTLKVNKVKGEALIISVGVPKVGNEINLFEDKEIVDYLSIKKLLEEESVYEIVPVGSKGIAYEMEQLALNNKLTPWFEKETKVDLKKSAGPATCVIAAIDNESLKKMSHLVPNVNIIGVLKANK